MGSRCRGEGVQDGISGDPSVRRYSQIANPLGQGLKRSVIRRGNRYVSQICYSQGPVQSPKRVLFKDISGSQKEWKMASRYKSKATESVFKETTLQNVHHSRCNSGSGEGRLVDLDRPEGRIFSRPHSPVTVEIPQILCRGGDVRIQSLTLWGNDGSQDLHQDDGASGRVHQKGDRVVHVSIPGRLLGERQGKIVLGLQIRENGPVHARCRAENQLGEIGANAFPGYRPYRTEAHDQSGHGIGTRRSDCGHNRVSQDDPGENDDFGSIVSQAARVSEQRHTPSGVGQVISASDTDLSPVVLETQYGIPGRSHSSPKFTQGPSEMVAEQGKSSEGVAVVSIDLESRACDRREYGGLGSLSSPGRRNQGSVVGPGEGTSYQLPGDAGGVPSLDIFQPDVESGGCNSSEKRQYDGGDIREQARGNEVVHTLLPDVGAAQLVSRSPVEDSGGIRTGREKCPGGPILKEGTSSRVVIVSDGSRESVSAVGSASGGPVREREQRQTTSVLLPTEGSQCIGPRCASVELGQPRVVCLSSTASHTQSAVEGKEVKNQDDSGGPKLGKKTMDVNPHRSTHRHSSRSTHKRKTPKDARPVGVPSGPSASKFSCLEDRRRRLRERGFREGTAKLATGEIRGSTESCYNARVRVFVGWCNKNGVKDPINSSLASVCNFLHEIFQEGKAAKTVGGYIAAISKWHRRIHGKKLCDIEEVANIRKATVIARPPRKIDYQSWSLPLVMDSLFQEPYEPLEGAQLKFLSHKTAFLVAVSTARRSSELGALSIEKSKFLVRPHGIEVGYVPGFVPKNARINYAGRTIVIPKFEEMASCEEERLLCPVRAVKCYKKRMKLLRKEGEQRLFLTYGNGDNQGSGASKKTIARWITETIKFAYANASEETLRVMKIKAHSVRAAATTYALLKGVEIRHILEAADWASPTTFIDFYFKPGSGPGQEFASSVLKATERN